MLLDIAMPSSDVTLAEHIVVHAGPATIFAAAGGLDCLRVRTPLLLAVMWVRGLPARVTGKAEEVPPSMRCSGV